MKSSSVFFKNFLSDPFRVGSVIPSGRALGRKMAEGIQDFQAGSILELGAGTGAVTNHIDKQLQTNCSYLGFEINPSFLQFLKITFPGLAFVSDGAQNLESHIGDQAGKIDFIVSSIPFTTIPTEIADEILAASIRALAPGGVFRTFLYCHTFKLKKNRDFVARCEHGLVLEKTEVVALNIPPAVVLTFRKANPSLSRNQSKPGLGISI